MAAPSAFPILQQTPAPHLHEKFSASAALEAKLRRVVRGEVRFDQASRALYATDASNYRQVPIGLVLPLDEADVVSAVAACREMGAPVLSRGGGTSLSGQCCNVAVVMDFLYDALDLKRIANVAIAVPAVTPLLPKYSPFLVMFLGLFAAGFVAIASAYVMEYLDPSFRTPQEVSETLRIPVLATMPKKAA